MTEEYKIIPIVKPMVRTVVMNGGDHGDGNHDDGNHDDHITAVSMAINPVDCDEPCNSIVTVTWQNIGKERYGFRPAIKVDGEKIELDAEITLNKNQITVQVFNLTNLMEGTYEICPYPN